MSPLFSSVTLLLSLLCIDAAQALSTPGAPAAARAASPRLQRRQLGMLEAEQQLRGHLLQQHSEGKFTYRGVENSLDRSPYHGSPTSGKSGEFAFSKGAEHGKKHAEHERPLRGPGYLYSPFEKYGYSFPAGDKMPALIITLLRALISVKLRLTASPPIFDPCVGRLAYM